MLQPYGEEESLSSTGLEELLPLVSIPHREGDGVDSVLELGRDGARPLVQLEVKQHINFYTEEVSNGLLKMLSDEKCVRKRPYKQSLF